MRLLRREKKAEFFRRMIFPRIFSSCISKSSRPTELYIQRVYIHFGIQPVFSDSLRSLRSKEQQWTKKKTKKGISHRSTPHAWEAGIEFPSSEVQCTHPNIQKVIFITLLVPIRAVNTYWITSYFEQESKETALEWIPKNWNPRMWTHSSKWHMVMYILQISIGWAVTSSSRERIRLDETKNNCQHLPKNNLTPPVEGVLLIVIINLFFGLSRAPKCAYSLFLFFFFS